MAPDELDKVLSKFYAEVKKTDRDDYQPESLKIMQSSTEGYLKENVYPVSIVQSREFHNSLTGNTQPLCANRGEVNDQTNPNGPKYNRHHYEVHGEVHYEPQHEKNARRQTEEIRSAA